MTGRILTTVVALLAVTCGWSLAGSAATREQPTPVPACSHAQAASLPDQLCPLEGGSGVAKGDFNGDGAGDLAIGVPYEDVGGVGDAGAVNVIYGSISGLTATGNQYFTQGSGAEAGDHFGAAVVSGDFNGDGYSDLAVGVPGEDLVSATDAGQVNVVYGSPSGLSTSFQQTWTQDSSGIEGLAEPYDQFGFSLAWGDFGRGPHGDLAIGVPGEDSSSGAVNVIYGTSSGLTSLDNQLWLQDSDGIIGSSEAGDRFGFSLASSNGSFFSDAGYIADCAYRDALAVGAPGEDLGSIADAGAVNVIFSTGCGGQLPLLDSFANEFLSQTYHFPPSYSGEVDLFGAAEAGDQLGYALAFGSPGNFFGGCACQSLAIGVPGENSAAGAVVIFHDYADGGTFYLFAPQLQAGARYGRSLAWGNFDFWETTQGLAVGAPYESDAGLAAAGAVYWYEHGNGDPDWEPLPLKKRLVQQAGHGEAAGNRFGWSLIGWNFNKDGATDLAVGVPNQSISTYANAGAVDVMYGYHGPDPGAGQLWTQDSPGIAGVAEPGDLFGWALY
jgi:hypothetical protein